MQNNRNQKILTFPDYIATLALTDSENAQHLAVGSGTYNADIIANIYIVECVQFKVEKTLQFHTKGIQGLAFSSDGDFLVSIGNHKENTIAVWDWAQGKLITSTYSVNILNDVKCKNDNRLFGDYLLEFCTVGNDVVTFWSVKEDGVLESNDLKIGKVALSSDVELSAVEYFYPSKAVGDMVLVGTTRGKGSFITLRRDPQNRRHAIHNRRALRAQQLGSAPNRILRREENRGDFLPGLESLQDSGRGVFELWKRG